jgi:hypothetical protein
MLLFLKRRIKWHRKKRIIANQAKKGEKEEFVANVCAVVIISCPKEISIEFALRAEK